VPEKPKIIPVSEHHDYALLWDLADDLAKQDAKTAEACWLAIMDAFWVGRLPALFVFGPRKGGVPGRVLTELPQRSVLALFLLGPERRFPAALRGWTLADYQKQPKPFGDNAGRDVRFGLAIRRADFDRWRRGPSTHSDRSGLAVAVKKRLDAGAQPGRTVQWTTFCGAVRDDCNGWIDRKQGTAKRGYSDKTIERIAKEVQTDK
jgi:hypothetical protein